MFGAKYSRLKFWSISIVLFIVFAIASSFSKYFASTGQNDNAIIFSVAILVVDFIWINTLANRIRDYGDNPWISLFALIPLANIGLALFYGIAKSNIKEVVQKSDNNSLTSAVYNHSKDIINGIKPAINEYKENHTTSKLDNDIKSFTIDEINNHPDRVQINDFVNSFCKKLKETKFNYLTEDEIYEKIMIEIETDNKVKSTWAKALSQSDGDKNKAESIYIKNRVSSIKDEQELKEKENQGIKKKQEFNEKQNNLSDEKFRIIGIGGGASNIVEFIVAKTNTDSNCLIIDSDPDYLDLKKVAFKMLITDEIFNGLDKIENFKIDFLDTFVGDAKSVTIIVTLGGVTGSIFSLYIIKYLNSKQIKINIIATKPFNWEGEKRSTLANEILAEINKYCSNLKVFENEDMLDYEDLSMKERFTMMDNNIFEETKKFN